MIVNKQSAPHQRDAGQNEHEDILGYARAGLAVRKHSSMRTLPILIDLRLVSMIRVARLLGGRLAWRNSHALGAFASIVLSTLDAFAEIGKRLM